MAASVRSRLKPRTLRKLRRCADGLAARFFLTVSAPQENHDYIFKEGHRETNNCSAVPFTFLLRPDDAGPGTGSEAQP
jgi:hypothetical protein